MFGPFLQLIQVYKSLSVAKKCFLCLVVYFDAKIKSPFPALQGAVEALVEGGADVDGKNGEKVARETF